LGVTCYNLPEREDSIPSEPAEPLNPALPENSHIVIAGTLEIITMLNTARNNRRGKTWAVATGELNTSPRFELFARYILAIIESVAAAITLKNANPKKARSHPQKRKSVLSKIIKGMKIGPRIPITVAPIAP